ncbi:hypothetical protein EC950183_1315, partial [Escherichia coli 95.0183]
MKQQKAMLIAL